MGRCRQLCIKDAGLSVLEEVIYHLSPREAPLLRSTHFDTNEFERSNDEHESPFVFHVPLFPSGSPHLKIAQLKHFAMGTWHMCAPALQMVASLRLADIRIDSGQTTYDCFRDALMALHFLEHLELQPEQFSQFGTVEPHLPVVLTALQLVPRYVGAIIRSFQAASLIALSLDGWGHPSRPSEHGALEDDLELQFPLLDHLILSNVAKGLPNFDVCARRFPDITRLTCPENITLWYDAEESCDINHILTLMCFGTPFNAETGSPPDKDWERWPKYKSLRCHAKISNWISGGYAAWFPHCKAETTGFASSCYPHLCVVTRAKMPWGNLESYWRWRITASTGRRRSHIALEGITS